MIPENQQTAVKNALQTAFGVDHYDEIEAIQVGLSNALTFRIVVKNKPYLMKIARTDQLSDPAKYYAYMKAAAEAGIAPCVWYLNAQDKISITDFIERKPLPIDKAKEIMPTVLRRLHQLPPFHQSVAHYVDSMDRIVQRFFSAKLLPEDTIDEIARHYTRIKEAYPRDAEDDVSCHNDLKPENYLYDGERVYLVDWEAAFLNDRYVDLAVVANFTVRDDAEAFEYLQSYFGKAPDASTKARFFLMQQLLHVFYLSIFFLYASKSVPIRIGQQHTTYREFHQHMWEGKIDLSDDENKLQYAIVHMNQLLSNVKTNRFEESLRIVAEKSDSQSI